MPTLTSLAKVAILASCVFGLASAEPAMFQQQDAVAEFGQEVWTEAQHVFHDVSSRVQDTVDKVKDVLHKGSDVFTTFTHPAFSQYALRYKKPTLCDPDVKQVKKMNAFVFPKILCTNSCINYAIDFWLLGCWTR